MTELPPPPNRFEKNKAGTEGRDRAEADIEKLRRQGGVFVEAVRATRMPMVLTDPNLPDDPIIFANQSFLSLSGYSLDEVLGQQPFFMCGPDTDPQDAANLRASLDQGRDETIETNQYRADGSCFIASILISAFKDEDGRTLHHFLSWNDITRRVHAERDAAAPRQTKAALRESEQRYRAHVSASADVVYRMSPDWTQMRRLDGRGFIADTAESSTDWMDRYIPPEERERIQAAIDQAIRNKSMFELEHRVIMADGTAGWTQSRAVAILDEEGEIVEWLGAARDISERKNAEERLRENEERFRGFAENSAAVLWIVNPRTMSLEYLSPAFERVWGENREAVMQELGRWAELVHPDDREQALQSLPRLLAGETFTSTYRIVRPDGTIRWIRDTGFPIHTDGMERVGGLAQDVTDLKEAESALQDREDRLRVIIETARDYAIFTMDPKGKVDGWWAGAEAVFGYAPAEIVGRDAAILWTPEDRRNGQVERERATARAEGRAADVRWHRRKDGRNVLIDGIVTPRHDAGGRVVGFIKIGHDVTERHRADERQRLLLAELQHRVRNIIATIRSIARRTSETSDSAEDYAQHLEGRLNAMARTQVILTREPGRGVDLETIVQEELLSVAADSQQHWCEGPEVMLGPKAAEVLTLALHELATNAVKFGAFIQPQGQLEIGWTIEPRGEERWLIFHWEESRLTGIDPAQRQGFGTELITRRVPYELGGSGRLEFSDDGVTATMEFPLKQGYSILETGAEAVGGGE